MVYQTLGTSVAKQIGHSTGLLLHGLAIVLFYADL